MHNSTSIRCASFHSVNANKGLIGFAELVINEVFVVKSVAVYSKKTGGIRLLYPDKRGFTVCHPTDKATSKEIEEVVYKAINDVQNKRGVCDDRYGSTKS